MMGLNVIKVSRVRPATDSVDPLILPLTFFDLLWLKLNPPERVTFYPLAASSRDSFYSVILPKLERSLSLVLAHFLPLSGHLKWDPQDPKPCIVVFPQEDAVSLVVAETDADFSYVSGKGLRFETELRALVPELPVFSDSASVLSLQITLFPNQGFCIGTTGHHAVMDGKTVGKFPKSWAHICKHGTIPKDFSLPTLLDRTIINVPSGLERKIIELLPYLSEDTENARTLKLPPAKDINDVVRITLELTQDDIKRLKERAKNESTRSELHLSTFVVTYAYVLTCVVKAAHRGNVNRQVRFMYAADFRGRLDPPVPEEYFGNCVLPIDFYGYEAKTFLGDDGFVNAVEILSDSVKGLGSLGVETIWELYEEGTKRMKLDAEMLVITVTGSNQFGIYGADFGWGRPINTEIMSLYQNDEFSLSERRNETGGVEIGISLKKHEMNVFLSLFVSGLGDHQIVPSKL